MQQLTVQEAAAATGWTPRMLRYVEMLGLLQPGRSRGGYRLYSAADLDRLRSLRVLLETHGLELGDVAVVLRLRRDADARTAVEQWLDSAPPPPSDAVEALRWEQDKALRLLGAEHEPSHHRVNVDATPAPSASVKETA